MTDQQSGKHVGYIGFSKNEELSLLILEQPHHEILPKISRSETELIRVCRVVDLGSNEEKMLIVPAVVYSYMKGVKMLVGKRYKITSLGYHPGKQYRDYRIEEIV